jgi:hypothetical protein
MVVKGAKAKTEGGKAHLRVAFDGMNPFHRFGCLESYRPTMVQPVQNKTKFFFSIHRLIGIEATSGRPDESCWRALRKLGTVQTVLSTPGYPNFQGGSIPSLEETQGPLRAFRRRTRESEPGLYCNLMSTTWLCVQAARGNGLRG